MKLSLCVKDRGCFYWQPLAAAPVKKEAPWFAAVTCGKNWLAKIVSLMFIEAGIAERKTNHSLRAAGVSQLFEAGVDEKIIQSRSGHRSTEALRMYERITPDQEKAVSTILTSAVKKEYRKELEAVSSSSLNVTAQSSMNIQSSSIQSMPGIQCYGCHINIYQGPVTKPEHIE